MKQKLTDAASGKQTQSEAQKKAPPKTPPTQAKPTNEKPASKTTPAKPANQSSASPATEKKVDISVCHCLAHDTFVPLLSCCFYLNEIALFIDLDDF